MSNPIFPDDHDDDTPDDGPRLPPARTPAPAADRPSDEPFLPAAAPVPSGQPPAASQNGDESAPFLPAASPIAPAPAAEPAPFDAKAMVESQKRVKTNPAYGAMPEASNEGREAARQLREQANRKRRRSRVLGRIVGVVVLGAVAAGAYLGYRAYQDSQDDDDVTVGDVDDESTGDEDSGESQADASDDTSGERSPGAGLTPLGVIAEQLEAQDTLNDAAPGGIIGGFIEAMDDARTVVDDINERSQGATDVADDLTADDGDTGGEGETGGDVGLATAGLSTLDVVVTRYDLSTAGAPVVQRIVADVADDTYFVATTSDGAVLAAVETDAASHYQFDVAAEEFARAARGPLSLEPGPDGLFVAPIPPSLVFPPRAVLHSTAIDVGLAGPDGAPLLDVAYRIDVAGFAATAPDVASVWLELFVRADPTAQPSIEPGTVEAITDVPADELSQAADEAMVDLAAPATIDATGAPEPAVGEAVLGWSVADNGLVDILYVHLGDGSAHWLYQVEDFDAPPFGGVLAPT